MIDHTNERCAPSVAAQRLWSERYPAAKVLFCGGSVIRGEGLASSDLDVVVLFERIPNAWRESFMFLGWPVEVFAHDPETLAYFFDEDRSAGRPSLAQMISEAIAVPEGTAWESAGRACARATIAETPPRPPPDAIERARYALTDLLDDFRDDRPRADLVAIACQLYPEVSHFILKSHGRWLGSGKTLPRLVRSAAPELSAQLEQGFETFFRTGERAPAIAAAVRALEQFGGEVFDGFRADAPPEWRRTGADVPLDFVAVDVSR